MDITPGTVLANRYRLSHQLGRGGMGEVFAAQNIRTGRSVALKLLRSESQNKSSAVARFRQEARAAGAINSDHVTQVLDVEEDAEFGIVLVFELLEGESLIDRLKRAGPIPFDELYSIIEQVWIGLSDAHKVGIIHRDLKPSNVFLEHRPDGSIRVKILDFGISKLPKEMGGETLTEIGQSLGTFSFMPPEQIGKAKTVDQRADIYAGATLIFQSLTGQLPYDARAITVMIEKKAKEDARRLSAVMSTPVDPRLDAFVAKGLERDPNKRFQSAAEALAAWRELRSAPPSSQHPGSADDEPYDEASTDSIATLAMPIAQIRNPYAQQQPSAVGPGGTQMVRLPPNVAQPERGRSVQSDPTVDDPPRQQAHPVANPYGASPMAHSSSYPAQQQAHAAPYNGSVAQPGVPMPIHPGAPIMHHPGMPNAYEEAPASTASSVRTQVYRPRENEVPRPMGPEPTPPTKGSGNLKIILGGLVFLIVGFAVVAALMNLR